MSKYTIDLRHVCEIYGRDEVESWFSNYNLSDYLSQEQINKIQEAGNWSKEKLARKIIDHYFMREIAYETPALFEHFAKVKMNEIMEQKLPLIWSKYIEYDPLVNVDYVESYTRNIEGTNKTDSETSGEEKVKNEREQENNGTTTSTSTDTASGLIVNSDTPQGQISKEAILGGSYASSTTANENTSNIESETNVTDTQNVEENIKRDTNGNYSQTGSDTKDETFRRTMRGNSGVMTTAQKLIQQYRDIVIAVDRDIIEECNSLFFALY
jgi:hypothetical protein